MKQKLFLLFIALALCAGAQTMAGLPQYGVTLSGDIQNPAVTNGSNQEILALDFDCTLASRPNGPRFTEQFIAVPDDTLHIGATIHTHGCPPTVRSGEPVIGVVLDSVVFADGSCVGPDRRGGCREMGEYFKAHALVAAPLLVSGDHAAAWAKIQQLANPGAHRAPDGVDAEFYGAQRDAAFALLALHGNGKDKEAQRLAEKLASLPTLHKK